MPTVGKHRTLVFLGDLIDRGPDSLGCLKTALNDAQDLAGVDEVIHLPGNHELMLADALAEAHKGPNHLDRGSVAQTWALNGGMDFMLEAYEAAGKDMPQCSAETLLTFGKMLPHPGYDCFEDMVRDWPSYFYFGDVLCVHAGLAPRKPHAYTLDLTHEDHFPKNRFDTEKHKRHWAGSGMISWLGKVAGQWMAVGTATAPWCCTAIPCRQMPVKESAMRRRCRNGFQPDEHQRPALPGWWCRTRYRCSWRCVGRRYCPGVFRTGLKLTGPPRGSGSPCLSGTGVVPYPGQMISFAVLRRRGRVV